MSGWETEMEPTRPYYLEGLTPRQRRKVSTSRDPYYIPPAKVQSARNTTAIAMLMAKNPHCGYCGCKLTHDTVELDKNDIDGPALACRRCNDRSR